DSGQGNSRLQPAPAEAASLNIRAGVGLNPHDAKTLARAIENWVQQQPSTPNSGEQPPERHHGGPTVDVSSHGNANAAPVLSPANSGTGGRMDRGMDRHAFASAVDQSADDLTTALTMPHAAKHLKLSLDSVHAQSGDSATLTQLPVVQDQPSQTNPDVV